MVFGGVLLSRITYDAYMTLEASMVFVIVLGNMIFIIYSMFFIYDRCLLDQDVAMLAIRGSSTYEMKKEQTLEYLKQQDKVLHQSDDKYVAFALDESLIHLKGNDVCVSKEGEVLTITKKRWRMKSSLRSLKIRPVNFVRNCRKAIEYGGTKGGNGIY